MGAGAWYLLPASGDDGGQASNTTSLVRVEVAEARRVDLPENLYGLGTVQAWNTVAIHTRVDGQIEKIGFNEGQIVKEGDLLVHIDPRPFQAVLDQAVAKRGLDEALLENSRQDLARFKTVGTVANSQQQIDTQQALVDQQAAQVKSDDGAIDDARVQLGYTTIAAPIGGRMGFRLVDRGNIVHASDQQAIAIITEVHPTAVIFTAPEEQLGRINAALKAGPLPVTALTSDGKVELDKGSVTLLDNQVDTTSGAIRLKAQFENSKNLLWPGLTVATRMQIATLRNTVVLPDTAVQRGPNGLFTYVVDDQGKVDLANVVTGASDAGVIAIEQGIAPGNRVVTSGFDQLQPGAQIEILNAGARSAMNSAR